jgi:hypothetical protein
MKRLNDTSAIIGMIPYETQSEHYSRSVRPIDNGFIIKEHHYGPNSPDGPTSKEVFVRDHPDQSGLGANSNAMQRAVDFMKK